ncbi:MAG TPA: Rpn family recombination-promoting nuclease/putative transposase [Verrucomicrobiales bacterium]|nr:Rpn family recombination-promoting nuclease/putative transposase [Verrucomicrobiales bacterium]
MSDSTSEPPAGNPEDIPDFQLASQPHDAYFKQAFSDPGLAAEFFRSRLPAPISAAVHWEDLTLVPGSFIKRTLQQAHSDLLFSVPAGGQKLLLYLLFEHQTTVDRAMPLRLLGYLTEIWIEHERTEGLPLPPVIPFVLHQGPDSWNVSTHFTDLVDAPQEIAEALRPFLPSFEYGLLDLSRFEPALQESYPLLRVVLQLMKLARDQQRVEEFWEWLALQPIRLPDALLMLSLWYMYHNDGCLDVEAIVHKLRHNPGLQNRAMSIAEKLIAKGRGEGREEGLAKGEWIGKIHLLEKLLNAPVSAKTELESKSLPELEQWFAGLQRDYDARFKSR